MKPDPNTIRTKRIAPQHVLIARGGRLFDALAEVFDDLRDTSSRRKGRSRSGQLETEQLRRLARCAYTTLEIFRIERLNGSFAGYFLALVKFTRQEANLIALLAAHGDGKVPQAIDRQLLRRELRVGRSALANVIRRVRQKLCCAGVNPWVLETTRHGVTWHVRSAIPQATCLDLTQPSK